MDGLGTMEGKMLTVLTLNCWGIPWISKERHTRMESIADHISSSSYDFVFLQEVWSKGDYQLIASRLQLKLPFSHYFDAGVFGSGLCLFSTAAITSFMFQPFSMNGYAHHVHQGDWFGGKGVGLASVVHSGVKIHLYITHLLAKYNVQQDDLLAHRLIQATQTAHFIKFTRQGADVCILAGDLNAAPDELTYQTLVLETDLKDSFLLSGKDELMGMTNATPNNSYTSRQQLKEFPYGQRIDYVFYWAKSHLKMETVDCTNPLPRRVPGHQFSYSDHEAVCCRLKISNSSSVSEETLDQSRLNRHRMKLLDVLRNALVDLQEDRRLYWAGFTAASLLLVFSLVTHFHYLQWAFGGHLWLWNCFWFVLVFFLTVTSLFCIAMAVVWNRTERESLLSWALSIS